MVLVSGIIRAEFTCLRAHEMADLDPSLGMRDNRDG
jgi:hypothetical protein